MINVFESKLQNNLIIQQHFSTVILVKTSMRKWKYKNGLFAYFFLLGDRGSCFLFLRWSRNLKIGTLFSVPFNRRLIFF